MAGVLLLPFGVEAPLSYTVDSQMSALGEELRASSLRELSQKIRIRAGEEGFDLVGIVPACELDIEGERLREWLARGYHADMPWMARDPQKRSDPRKLLPDARSVVVVALNYYTPNQHENSPDTGKVSRYAWGDDYHEVVSRKLRALLDWVTSEVPDARGKLCVDIQPMMDKAWAVRAGLGWLGKHTNLITTEFGSWVFIGELLLNLELDYDCERIEDHCGTCNLCIDSCPTKAITEPYVVDSTRCISYVTIESREPEIDHELTPLLNGWVYGCDICQDVCPWNRFETVTKDPAFAARQGNVNADLHEIAAMTAEQYASRFRGSAMKRAKLVGLQRNARALLSQPKQDA